MAKTKRIKTVKDQKRAKKTLIIICVSIVSIILAATLICGFVTNKGFTFLDDYTRVRITSTEGNTQVSKSEQSDDEQSAKINNLFAEGLKSTRYSVLRSVLEGDFDKNFRFEKETETYYEYNDDKKVHEEKTRDKKVEIHGTAIASELLNPESGKYILTFSFARANDGTLAKCIVVEGETIYFDTASVIVSASENNIIESFKFYFYDSQMTYGNSEEVQNYNITPVFVKAKTLKLTEKLAEIYEEYK